MKIAALFFFLFLSQAKSAERTDSIQIDWKYIAGKYLIYDCERGHYACVSQEGHDNCKEERKYAIGVQAKTYPCAALEAFTDQVACIHKMYKVVELGANKRFCFPK